jgi:ketosteroid isomerase-like protein
VILASGNWVLHSDGPGGSRLVETGAPTLVLRRIDGAWKIAVIALWGASSPGNVPARAEAPLQTDC